MEGRAAPDEEEEPSRHEYVNGSNTLLYPRHFSLTGRAWAQHQGPAGGTTETEWDRAQDVRV